MTTKMVISKQSLLSIKQRCLDKLDDDATDRERYLVGEYEFELRLRDAVRAAQKMAVSFHGFANPTMDTIEVAATRLKTMLEQARDDRDRYSAHSLFEERVFRAIADEIKSDAMAGKTEELVTDKAVDNTKEKAADPPAPEPAPAAPSKTEAVVEPVVVADRPRIRVEVLDTSTVPDDTGNLAQELEQVLAHKDEQVATEIEQAAQSIYDRYDKSLSMQWSKPPPVLRRKKGVRQ